MVGSPADIAEFPIKFMPGGFRFKEGRMRVVRFFLNFLPLGFMFLRLGLSSIKLTLAFISFLVLELRLC